MHSYSYKIFFLIILFPHMTLGEEVVNILDLINDNQDPSYVTAGGGINLGRGHGAFGDQILEAQISPHFNWFNGHCFGMFGSAGKITPKVQLRMFTSNSSPVKTPGFLPRFTYYFWFHREEYVEKNDNFFYFSVMLSHHSNGQSGNFYNPDGSINIDNGSFSTNFFEFASYQVWESVYLPAWTKLSLEWHPGFNRSSELKDQYEDLKIVFSLRNNSFPWIERLMNRLDNSDVLFLAKTAKTLRVDYKLFASASYILHGRDYTFLPGPDASAVNVVGMNEPVPADFYDKINLGIKLNLRPLGWNDINVFFKYDYGYDDYNINFWQPINRIQFGFSADPSTFSNLKK